jgi:ElaB/YqjD/DUF883 family membrane-anchored ribosome-binding protein
MTKLTDSLKNAGETAKDTLSAARSKASASQDKARQQATKALDKSKALASTSIKNTKKVASEAAAKTEQALDANPLMAVMGGLALGLIAGALLPRTKSEEKLLGGSSKKLKKKAQKVADAAKAAGKEKVDSLGLNTDLVKDQFRDLVMKAGEAVKAAGKAASESAKQRD